MARFWSSKCYLQVRFELIILFGVGILCLVPTPYWGPKKVKTVKSVSFLLFSKNEPILETNYDEDDELHDSETTTLLDNSDINNN